MENVDGKMNDFSLGLYLSLYPRLEQTDVQLDAISKAQETLHETLVELIAGNTKR